MQPKALRLLNMHLLRTTNKELSKGHDGITMRLKIFRFDLEGMKKYIEKNNMLTGRWRGLHVGGKVKKKQKAEKKSLILMNTEVINKDKIALIGSKENITKYFQRCLKAFYDDGPISPTKDLRHAWNSRSRSRNISKQRILDYGTASDEGVKTYFSYLKEGISLPLIIMTVY